LHLDAPGLVCWILDGHLLRSFLPHHSLKDEFLDVFCGLLDALADQVDEDGVTFLDRALHFHEANIIINHIWVESDIEVQLIVGR
jgi:hypothetical protein